MAENNNILTRLSLQFEGLSHIRYGNTEQPAQCLYMLTDLARAQKHGGPTPQLRAKAKDPTRIREIFLGFFGAIQKGLSYKPSSSAEQRVIDAHSTLLPERSILEPITYYQKLFALMSELDEEGFAGIDPLLTIHQGTCYFEVFDRSGKRALMLELSADLWEEGYHAVDGCAHINMRRHIHTHAVTKPCWFVR